MTKPKDTDARADKPQAESPAAIETPKTDSPARSRLSFIADTTRAIVNARDAATGAIMKTLSARPRLSRVTVLAASITLAAALGSVVGAIAGAALLRPAEEPVTVPTLTVNAFKGPFSQLRAEIAALKSSIEASNKNANAQFAKMTERVERAEKAQSEPAARLARSADSVERLERKSASGAASALVPLPIPAPGPTLASAPDTTGSVVAKQQDKPPVVSGWVLREIFDGRALVESRHGLYEIGPGAPLPGLGRVETIRRQDGRWVVVTPKGLIVAER